MIAARIHRFGPPEVITLDNIPTPVPGRGEVLIRVAAAGVGPWDGWIRAGKSALPQPLPLTLGSDIAGAVVAVGPDTRAFAAGDAVFGVCSRQFTGGYAEYCIAPSTMIARKPERLEDADAASMPVVAVTAWQMLIEHARLTAGQRVMVTGAAGNVGRYVVQLARLLGLEVIATAALDDAPALHELGADEVVEDTPALRLADAIRPVDAVLDLVGGAIQARAFEAIKLGGQLVSAVSPPDPAKARQHGVHAGFFMVQVTTAALGRLARMVDAGELATSVGCVLPLESAATAHEMLEGRLPRPKGKIVLDTATVQRPATAADRAA
jgi:NADPH:quinone reductase-like Zn-dependent oxidoreductase